MTEYRECVQNLICVVASEDDHGDPAIRIISREGNTVISAIEALEFAKALIETVIKAPQEMPSAT